MRVEGGEFEGIDGYYFFDDLKFENTKFILVALVSVLGIHIITH